jgi:hypothetical protein
MAISLDAFQRAGATGGRITLDKHHEDGVKGSLGQMGGKTVTWVKDTWPSSSVKEENRAAIRSFIDAVRSEYGNLLGDLALARLTGDIQTGRPLTDRTVTMILTASDKALVDLAKMNESTAKTAARSDDPKEPGSFGQVFEQVAKAMVSSAKISDLDPGRLAEARLAIETAIKEQAREGGIDHRHLVGDDEAHAIATREIKKLLGADSRDAMIRDLTTPGDGGTHFDKAFAKELTARGFTQLTHKAFDLGPLLQATRSAIVEASFNPNENAYTRPVDRVKAEALLKEQIKNFLDGQKASLDMVKQLAAGNAKHEAVLTKYALGSESMSPAMLEKLWQSREVTEKALKALQTSSVGEQVKALNELAKTITKAAGDLNLDGPGAERFRSTLLSLAMDTAELESHAVQNVRQALTSPKLTGVEDAIAVGNRHGLPPGTHETAQELAALFKPLRQAVGAAEPPPRQVDSLAGIPHETLTALQNNGIDLRACKAKELAAGNAKHETALQDLVKQNPAMTTERLEKLWQARGATEKALKGIATAHTLTEQIGALKELTAAVSKVVKDLGLQGDDADRFRSEAMSLAQRTTELGPGTQHLLKTALSSHLMVDVGDALAHAAKNRDLPTTTPSVGDLRDQLGRLHVAMGLSRPPDGPRGPLDQVAPQAFQALRAHGIEIRARSSTSI